jgi:hypothetical protein
MIVAEIPLVFKSDSLAKAPDWRRSERFPATDQLIYTFNGHNLRFCHARPKGTGSEASLGAFE